MGETAGEIMRRILTLCVLIATIPTRAASATIHLFSDLALAPQGDHTATVESEDPGNLPDEPHAKIVVRGPDGKVFLNFDPCQTCRYTDPAFSSRGELVFLATDEKKGQTTLYHAPNGVPRPLTVIAGLANTARFSPDGSRIALLVTLGAKKKTGATEAAAPQVGEIGETNDEQRIAVLPAGRRRNSSRSRPPTPISMNFPGRRMARALSPPAAKGNGDNNWWIATLDYIDAAKTHCASSPSPRCRWTCRSVSPDGKPSPSSAG